MTYESHINSLTIEELRDALKNAGLQDGPITGSTECSYRRRLVKHLYDIEDKAQNKEGSDVSDEGSEPEDFNEGYGNMINPGSTEGSYRRRLVNAQNSYEGSEPEEFNEGLGDMSNPGVREPEKPRKFVPIKWNPDLQRYESVYEDARQDMDDNGLNQADNSWTNMLNWIAGGILVLTFIFVAFKLREEHDPYTQLEDSASNFADPK